MAKKKEFENGKPKDADSEESDGSSLTDESVANAELTITARDPESGEETVVVDTEAGIENVETEVTDREESEDG